MFKLWANGAQIYGTVYLTCGVHLHNRQVSCSYRSLFAQVIIQVTALQINKQDQKCLLVLISIQNNVYGRSEPIWFI